jgi:hypothetical protein
MAVRAASAGGSYIFGSEEGRKIRLGASPARRCRQIAGWPSGSAASVGEVQIVVRFSWAFQVGAVHIWC